MRRTERDETCKFARCNSHRFACFVPWSHDSTLLPEDVHVFLASDCAEVGAPAPTEVADSLSAAPLVWFLFHCSNLVELIASESLPTSGKKCQGHISMSKILQLTGNSPENILTLQ